MQPRQAKWSLSNVTPLKAAVRGCGVLTVKPGSAQRAPGPDLLPAGKKGELEGWQEREWVSSEGWIKKQ